MNYGSLRPGRHEKQHLFEEGRARWLAAGGPRRCRSRNKSGNPCGGWALKGCDYCTHHAPNDVRRARRLRLLSRPRTEAQADRLRRREHARVQRTIWKRDRSAPGATVTLGEREGVFLDDVQALGFDPERFTPATLDAARWAWIQVQTKRLTWEQFRVRVSWHIARDPLGV